MGSIRRSDSVPQFGNPIQRLDAISGGRRSTHAKPSSIYDGLVRNAFFPAKVQLHRSLSDADMRRYTPQYDAADTFTGSRLYRPYVKPDLVRPGTTPSMMDIALACHRPRYFSPSFNYYRYIDDDYRYVDDIDRRLGGYPIIYRPPLSVRSLFVYPITEPAYRPMLPYSAVHWRRYDHWRSYIHGSIAGVNRSRYEPFWRRTYTSVYPPTWHLSPLNYYYTHGYY